MFKRLLAFAAVSLIPSFAWAAPSVRLVNISTNTLTRQTGSIYIAGANISTTTISSATITSANIASLTMTNGFSISSATITTLIVTTITPTGIVGTTTNNNASVGNYGEYISSYTDIKNTAADSTYGDLVQITLTAGDWDVSGVAVYYKNTAVTFNTAKLGISSTSGNSATGLVEGDSVVRFIATGGAVDTFDAVIPMIIPNVRMSLSGTAPIYLKMFTGFSSGQTQVDGRISARRMR